MRYTTKENKYERVLKLEHDRLRMKYLVSRKRNKRLDPRRNVQQWCGALDTESERQNPGALGKDLMESCEGQRRGLQAAFGKPVGLWETTVFSSPA